MPRLDGTGPEGKGSMTGRGLGNCNTSKNSKIMPKRGQKRDGTGPEGKGPMTGRGLGNCNTKIDRK